MAIPRYTLSVDELTFTPSSIWTKKPSARAVKKKAKDLMAMQNLGSRALEELDILHRAPELARAVVLEIQRVRNNAKKVASNLKQKEKKAARRAASH